MVVKTTVRASSVMLTKAFQAGQEQRTYDYGADIVVFLSPKTDEDGNVSIYAGWRGLGQTMPDNAIIAAVGVLYFIECDGEYEAADVSLHTAKAVECWNQGIVDMGCFELGSIGYEIGDDGDLAARFIPDGE